MKYRKRRHRFHTRMSAHVSAQHDSLFVDPRGQSQMEIVTFLLLYVRRGMMH